MKKERIRIIIFGILDGKNFKNSKKFSKLFIWYSERESTLHILGLFAFQHFLLISLLLGAHFWSLEHYRLIGEMNSVLLIIEVVLVSELLAGKWAVMVTKTGL